MRIRDFKTSYEQDESIWQTPVARAWIAALFIGLLAFPVFANGYLLNLACLLGIHLIATAGLNIMTGYTGLISLGHAAFMGVGCYTAAYLAHRGVPFYLTIPAAGLLAAAIGIVVGIPSLRIKGLYLAIATLATQFLLVFIFQEWTSVTGGASGTVIPAARIGDFLINTDQRIVYVIWFCAVVLLLAARNLFRTRVGRAFIAIRDKDISAQVLGINLLRYKLSAVAIATFYAGVAGALLGYYYRAMSPEYFTLHLSIFYLAAIIVGGLGSTLGSILGAVFMTMLPEVLRSVVATAAVWSPRATEILSPLQQAVFGVIIITFLIFEPHGLTDIWRRIRRFFHLWPFRA
jgi:branched-chain amino acid transport system permease protein